MADRIATAVLHCALNEPQKIIDLATRVHEKLYAAGSPYITPPVTETRACKCAHGFL